MPENINTRFDHTALKPEVDSKTIHRLCDEAKQYRFHSVVVNPVWVTAARTALSESDVKVTATCGFPLGANCTEIKLAEAVLAVADGAHEIDMVANIGWLVAGELAEAETEIRRIRDGLPREIILKVIIEASKLTDELQTEAARIVARSGAQFVKTSTGFFGGATTEQVRRLIDAGAGKIEVKASGGIKTLEQCRQLIDAGATRLGSSASVTIMREQARLTDSY